MKARTVVCLAGLLVLATFFTGCQTIFHGKDDVTIQTAKPGVEFEVLDGAGKVVASGTTPYTVQLNARVLNGAYTIRFTNNAGTETTQKLNGEWKFVLFPDFISTNGFGTGYIVDIITGKAFYLPATVNLNISYNQDQTRPFVFATLDDIRPEMRQYLIPADDVAIFEPDTAQ